MDADEAVHALEALRLHDDLAQGHVLDFARDTFFPERWHPPVNEHLRWYPFVHAWSLLPSFALLGPSDVAARLPSVVFLLGTLLTVYALGRRLARGDATRREASGLLAVLLFLGAPNLLTFSAQCLIETLTLCACFLALFLYLRSLERGHPPGRALLAGAALGIALLTKYDHGGMLALSLGLAELVRVRFRPLALLSSGAALLLGVALLVLVLWFAHPAKLEALKDSLAHPFYGTPRTILIDFVLTWFVEYGASLAGGLLALAAFIALARRLGEPAVRAVWIWALVSTVFYALRGRFHFRYNLVEAPIFLLLASVAIPDWVERAAGVLAAPWTRRRFRFGVACAIASAIGLGVGRSAMISPSSAYALLALPLEILYRLRADHFGMQLAPDDYVAYFAEHYAELARFLGGSLAALSLAVLILSLVRWDRRRLPLRAARAGVWCALALAALPGAVWLYRRLPELVEWELECDPELNEVYAFVGANVPQSGTEEEPVTVLLGGGWDQLTNNSLRWYLIAGARDPRPRYGELDVTGDMIGSVVFPPEPRIAWWVERLASAPAPELPERIVLVEPGPDFRYHTRFGPEVALYRAVIEARGSHDSLARRAFPQLGCTVQVLARRQDSAPIEPPYELMHELGVVGREHERESESSRVWVGTARGWDVRDDALRHFVKR